MQRHIPVRTLAKDEPRFQLDDCGMPGEIIPAEEEKSYRRGYSQGFSRARQFIQAALDEGWSVSQILNELESCESVIMKWRCVSKDWIRGQPVKAQWPPEPSIAHPREQVIT